MNKKIIVASILAVTMLLVTSYASALSKSNEQSTEKNVVGKVVYDGVESSSLGTTTVHVRVFGWYFTGSPYSLKGASVYIRAIGVIPSMLLGKNLVGSGYTDGAGQCCIDIPAPTNIHWCYLVYAKMQGYRPIYDPNLGMMSFLIIKLKADDNPDEIWLTLLGK